jgi:lysophospholipase L1-like esterase
MHKDLEQLQALIDKDYQRHIKRFEKLTPGKPIVFLGDSMIAYFPLSKFNLADQVYNLGIPGDTTIGVLDRLEQVYRLKPKQVIVHVGLNDYVLTDHQTSDVFNQLLNIYRLLKDHIKHVKITFVNLTPINKSSFQNQMFVKYRTLEDADDLNARLSKQKIFDVVDVFSQLVDENHELKLSLTTDGIHLNDDGYKIYYNLIKSIL